MANNTNVYKIDDDNKNLQYSTRISIQCSVMIYIGKEFKKRKIRVDICMCITDLPLYTPETNTTL